MSSGDVQIKLKHLIEDPDRHGNVRIYVRIPGRAKVRIREAPGTDAFMLAYHAAVDGKTIGPQRPGTAPKGSFRAICQAYMASGVFKRLDAVTSGQRRHHLEELCLTHGGKPVALLRPKHVARMVEKIADTPAAANARLKALRALFRWAFKNLDEVEHNPTLEVERIQYLKTRHHPWTDPERAQYEARHPIGTTARLAMALLFFVAGRREDAVRLGPQHVQDVRQTDGLIVKRLRYRQGKNEHLAPVDVDMPMPAELLAIIEATPSGHLTFLVTSFGRPYTPAGFGNAVRDWCDQANLHHCSAHGLRSARSNELAEHDATPHQIAAITGHQTLEEVTRYTKKASRSRMADAAMAKVGQSRQKA